MEMKCTCHGVQESRVRNITQTINSHTRNSRDGTDHGWGATYTAFGSGLSHQVFGYNERVDPPSSALGDIIPKMTESSRGDVKLTTQIEKWNACILDALALPGLPRLGYCPDDLRLRPGLARIPEYREEDYYPATAASTTSPPPFIDPNLITDAAGQWYCLPDDPRHPQIQIDFIEDAYRRCDQHICSIYELSPVE